VQTKCICDCLVVFVVATRDPFFISLLVRLSTKSMKFGSRYLLDRLSDGDEQKHIAGAEFHLVLSSFFG